MYLISQNRVSFVLLCPIHFYLATFAFIIFGCCWSIFAIIDAVVVVVAIVVVELATVKPKTWCKHNVDYAALIIKRVPIVLACFRAFHPILSGPLRIYNICSLPNSLFCINKIKLLQL